jgi:hypothetical protein
MEDTGIKKEEKKEESAFMKLKGRNLNKMANRYCELENAIVITSKDEIRYIRQVLNEKEPEKSIMLVWSEERIYVVDLFENEIIYK